MPIVHRDVSATEVPESLAKVNWLFFRKEYGFEASFQTLLKALDTDLDWVKLHTRLLVRAQEWEIKGREDSLLLRGRDLQHAEEWLAHAAEKEPKPTSVQIQYIPASRKATTRRQRILVLGIVFGLVVAIVLALVAFIQRQRLIAKEEAAVALSRQLDTLVFLRFRGQVS